MAKDYLIDEATGKPYIQGKSAKYRIDINTGGKFVKRTTREEDNKLFRSYSDEGVAGKSKPRINNDGFYKENWITPKKIKGGFYSRWTEETPFELGEKGKYRLNPDTGKKFTLGDTRKEDENIFQRYKDLEPPREADGFIREEWKSLKSIKRKSQRKPDDGKRDLNALRVNPETNEIFVGGDTRPKIPTQDGKIYPQDGKIYAGTTWFIDDNGFYSEIWLDVTEKECKECGEMFLAAHKNRKLCNDCSIVKTTTAVQRQMWESVGEKPCFAEPEVKMRTGCDDKPKPLTEKYFEKKLGVWRHYCHDCLSEINWARDIFKTYNVTAEQFYEELEKQGGVCAICKSPDTNTPHRDRFFIDHDHYTGINRGILCTKCNSMIGKQAGRDDPQILYAGYEYLARALLVNIQIVNNPDFEIVGFTQVDKDLDLKDMMANLKSALNKRLLTKPD